MSQAYFEITRLIIELAHQRLPGGGGQCTIGKQRKHWKDFAMKQVDILADVLTKGR
ncbi:hypothetical protein ACFQZE_15025 [Paenibacillus sp. GCM10027627]